MTPEERLRRAEAFAVVYGWCGVNTDGPREKVAYELWQEWARDFDVADLGPKAHPDLNNRVKAAEKEAR